ncbi:hypothetical protein NQ317_014717 [Molorchus minor]|uniref:KIF-binding protein n=1 Tax=Molorchus minor TaxID=1323400 RepID=A0ABQ9JZ41_9CUCU|nr:hypothetical protein NQ317_014717 [Molorchus minor]
MDRLPDGFLQNLRKQFQELKDNSSMIAKDATDQSIKDSGDGNKKREYIVENEFSLIVSKIDEILSTLEKDSAGYLRILSMKASLLYEKAKICLTNSWFEKSKESLENSLNLIMDYSTEPQIAFLYLRIINYLSYVLSRSGELERARTLLEKVIDDGINCQPNIYSTEDLFLEAQSEEATDRSKIDKIMVNNMHMLGWIYGKLGLNELYAAIQFRSLQKELDYNNGDPVQWAIRCYRLGSLFLADGKWKDARYLLVAAQVILDPLEAGVTPNPLVYRAQAELARIWVNYGLYLFSVSRKSILDNKFEDASENAHEKSCEVKAEPTTSTPPDQFKFTGFEVTVPNVPVSEIHENEEARSLFAHTLKWLKRARLYYTLRDYPIQYVNIILELSELYRLLAFYESDIDCQYNLQKKRFETLEALSGILKDVRPNCYVSVSVELIREIIEVQIELMNLNLKKIYNPTEEVNNINEEDLKRRIDAVIDISSKMNNIDYEGVQDCSAAADIDLIAEDGNKTGEAINLIENSMDGKDETSIDKLCP